MELGDGLGPVERVGLTALGVQDPILTHFLPPFNVRAAANGFFDSGLVLQFFPVIWNGDANTNQSVRVSSKLQPGGLVDTWRSHIPVTEVEVPRILSPRTVLVAQQLTIRILGLPATSQAVRIQSGPRVQIHLAHLLPGRTCLLN